MLKFFFKLSRKDRHIKILTYMGSVVEIEVENQREDLKKSSLGTEHWTAAVSVSEHATSKPPQLTIF